MEVQVLSAAHHPRRPAAPGWTRSELAKLRRLSTPTRIQEYLDRIPYNTEKRRETLRSPRRVLRDGTAHCMEGALLAAAALEVAGDPPLVMDLTAVDDDDHVIAPFRRRRLWGAVATSKFSGLRFRSPVYRTLRELAMSYFEPYFSLVGQLTLRGYGIPINLTRFDALAWRTSEEDLWPVSDALVRVRHVALISSTVARDLQRVDGRLKAAGLLGYPR